MLFNTLILRRILKMTVVLFLNGFDLMNLPWKRGVFMKKNL
jgi:hypothetical protein